MMVYKNIILSAIYRKDSFYLFRRLVFLICGGVLVSNCVFGQTQNTISPALDSAIHNNHTSQEKSSGKFHENSKTDFDMTVGSGMMFTSGNSPVVNSYIMPDFTYKVNSDVSLRSGGVIGNNGFMNGSPNMASHQTNYMFYVSGNYQVNEHFNVSGTVYNSEFQYFNRNMNQSGYQAGTKGMVFQLNYKKGDFSFNTMIDISRGPQMNLRSPYFNRNRGFPQGMWMNNFNRY